MNSTTSGKRKGSAPNFTFFQKSTLVSLVTVGISTALYVAHTWPMLTGDHELSFTPNGFWRKVVRSIVIIVGAQIVVQIVLVMGSGGAPKKTDIEKQASLRGKQIAYGVLSAGSVSVLALFLLGFSSFYLANAAMGGLMLSEIIKYAFTLIYASGDRTGSVKLNFGD